MSLKENSFHNARICFSVRHICEAKLIASYYYGYGSAAIINLARFDLNRYCCLNLYTESVLTIRFAVQLYFNWNNYTIKFVNWLFSTISKSSFETSPKQPRTMWRHNAAVMSCCGFVTSQMWCIATVTYAAHARYHHQPRLSKMV